MIGPVSREVRFRVVGALIILGLAIEVWTFLHNDAFGFMLFLGGAASLIALGVVLNVYWVSLELTITTDPRPPNPAPPSTRADEAVTPEFPTADTQPSQSPLPPGES